MPMKFLPLLCITSLFTLWGASVSAFSLAHFERASVMFESQSEVTDYILTLGTLKKVDGRWRAEREQRLSGQLSRLTQELEERRSEEEAFEFYRDQALKMGGQELFLCESRRCGSSGTWANQRFDIKQLYGLDQYQHYSALAINLKDGQQAYIALYAVRRGTGRSYVQVDILTTSNRINLFSSSEVVTERLRGGREFRLPELTDGQLEPEQLEAVVNALRVQRSWYIGIVGLDVAAGTIEQQQARSLESATRVLKQLVEGGISEDKLRAYGVGGLAPNSIPDDRETSVNLVKIVPEG
ncbi:DUF4892 domain-containing protein [Pseudomaricurvus sp.]|uniref:DUF4892 domain-containing protein n=1 Tax=Pseudomaricurvus sp. TaxID=2004510 RepID=UPI003F6AA523